MAARQRERIYIVPRWRAMFFAGLPLVIFGLGYLKPTSRDVSQPLVIALVVAGLVALIQTNDSLRGIQCLSFRAGMAPAGSDVTAELTLANQSDRERLGLEIRRSAHWLRALWSKSPRLAEVPVLNAGQSTVVRVAIPTRQRGIWPMPDFWVNSLMPVGLCFAWKVFPGQGTYVVYPRPRGIPLDLKGTSGLHLAGGISGENQDVSGHRPYEIGDPLSRLDWRVFARRGKVVVRTLEEGSSGEVLLRWSDTRFLADTEARLEQLSLWIEQCSQAGRPFRLQLDARREWTHHNLPACYEALAGYTEEPG